MGNIISRSVDVAIIGAGPGGLGAAIRAKHEGAQDVVLIERSEELGGVLPQCIHNGFGLHYFKEELTGPAYAYKLIKKAERAGVEALTKTMVIALDNNKTITATTTDSIMEIRAKSIILGMGCRERARGSIRIPGYRPAGIFTAGTAQRLINLEGYLPGKKVVILGSGDIGMIMARRLTLEGAQVIAVVELLPYIGGLIRNEVQCLHDFNIPVYTSHTIIDVLGEHRLEKVKIAKVDQQRQVIPGSEKEIECDTLLLSVGLIPENELSLMAGVKLNPLTGGPMVDENWQTSVPGIFAGGNVVHVHDLADYVTESSEQAAVNAISYLRSREIRVMKTQVKAGQNIRYIVPNYISGDAPVSFYMRVASPCQKATINIGGQCKKSFDFVRPSEQIRIDIPAERLRNLGETLTVDCEGEEVTYN